MKHTGNLLADSKRIRLHVNGIAAGLHFSILSNNSGQLQSQKIIKKTGSK